MYFSTEQKWTFYQRLQTCLALGGTFYINTHIDPDQDGAGAAALIMNKFNLPPTTTQVAFHFIPQGEVLTREAFAALYQLEPHDLVMNIDTGKVLDIDNLVFDHHYPECPFHSATDIIYDLLYLREGYSPPPKYAQDIVQFVNRIDSGHEVQDFPPEVYGDIDLCNQMLHDAHGRVGRFVANLPGPQWLMVMIKHAPPGTPDNWKMANLVFALACEIQRAKDFSNVERTFVSIIEPQLEIKEINGLHIAFSSKNPFTPSDFRDAMNRRHANDVDVVVYENTGMPEERGRYAVAVLSRKTDMVGGMAELRDTMQQLAPKAKIFLHPKLFLIYGRAINGIPLPFDFNKLKALVEAHLSWRDPTIPRTVIFTSTEATLA
ncbi:MAG: hypothetical protein UT32_C0017G0004 [Parcubacteria group bacterium GW2011_GWC2_39_14]|nr:MAG: hypothetical protein UT32_C0017G0004 [Parcubacteria group bacterium GW2011_GWC2_39_14]KKR54331.1 MAG: hypothetical protein UT91_C0018G0005 [Parcubacteria group bacterium GW2011_GWA2_40_23]